MLALMFHLLTPPSAAGCDQSCPMEVQDSQGCCPPDYAPPTQPPPSSRPGVALPLEVTSGPVLRRHGYELLALPRGLFIMGGAGEDERVHNVEFTRDVLLGRTEVTRGLYAAVMGEAPGEGGEALPVTEVSWLDAVRFCNALSAAEGLPPAYRIAGQEVSRLPGEGYRLPTEAEWEYAASSGARSVFAGTSDEAALCAFANVAPGGTCDDGRDGPAQVASYQPTPWGFYDLSGNAAEWVWDWYGPYPEGPRDPTGPESGAMRAVRGGSWWLPYGHARVSRRYWAPPEQADANLGFRLAREAPGEP